MDYTAQQKQIEPWVDLLSEIPPEYAISPTLFAGLILTESSGNPWAIRVERGFWRRYFSSLRINYLATKSKYDNRWAKYPDLASCSYGLCQIMLPVAWEQGYIPKYPTELLDPKTNIELGCKILSGHMKRLGSLRKALLRYNGGGDPGYPDRVMEAAALLQDLFYSPNGNGTIGNE